MMGEALSVQGAGFRFQEGEIGTVPMVRLLTPET
jgi:hypothetical protein